MKKIQDNIPLITVLLVIFGFSNLQVYYGYFNINVISYISVTEILLSFLPIVDSSAKLLAIVVIFLMATAFEAFKKKTEEDIKWEKIKEGSKTTWRGALKELFSHKTYAARWYVVPFNILFILIYLAAHLLVFVVCLGGIFIPVYLIIIKDPSYYLAFRGLAFFWILGFLYFTVKGEDWLTKKLDTFGQRLVSRYYVPGAVIFVALSLSILYQYKRAIQLGHGFEEEKISFTYDGKQVRSAKDTLYLGRTQSTLFLRKPSTKKVLIFPAENITNLELIKVDSIPK